MSVHAPTEDKSDDKKNSFFGELEYVLDQFPKYHVKMLLGHFNGKVGTKDILKPTNWE
jgi:hypothetical protein